MKKLFLLSSLVALISLVNLQAQISEQTLMLSFGSNNAMVLEIPDSDAKLVNKLWKTYLEKEYKSKTKWLRKENHWFSDDAKIVGLGGANTVDIYGRADQSGENVNMIMWVDLGGAYLASETHPDRYTEGEKMLMRFALEVARENTRLELKEEEKNLKGIQSELKKLQSENTRYHKDIEKAQEAIKRAEASIEQNVKDQEATNLRIEAQQKLINSIQKKLSDL